MQNRIYYLFKKLQKENFDFNKINLFSDIEKPNDKSKFAEYYHPKLYTEVMNPQICSQFRTPQIY